MKNIGSFQVLLFFAFTLNGFGIGYDPSIENSKKITTDKMTGKVHEIQDLASITDQKDAASETREGKFLIPSFKFKKFPNIECEGLGDLSGTCFNARECAALGGVGSGTCAGGFGICCLTSASCGDTITINNTNFLNPNHPAPFDTEGSCVVTLDPPAGAVQIQLQFVRFNIIGPVAGDCDNDTFVVIGDAEGSTIPVLCGLNTGQHIFLDLQDDDNVTLVFRLSEISFGRLWAIQVSFLSRYDNILAPSRCLQFKTALTGEINTFNSDDSLGTAQLINDQFYSICFAYFPGFCDVSVLFTDFDVGTMTDGICDNDFVGFNSLRYCGNFTDFSIRVTASGPVIITVFTDGDNSLLQTGFTASYMFIPC